ncbi:hypothetical protein CHS0354_018654 [Potamilus streckersoni]|uniref:Phosphatidylinositol-3,4,5-trisphosphate 3-phosphatase n=1 Tax=Potamilus streckersoni TaxID=2493646 RepID=A0AAE0VXC7_9BIVA|nr:hypothetical protein CHS0354_018654 [Potamilus streckersoni]
MTSYERFDENPGQSDLTTVDIEAGGDNQNGKIEDTQIKMQKVQEKEATIQIYSTEKKDSVDYIDDPSQVQLPASQVGSVRMRIREIMEHIAFRIMTMLLITVDFTVVVIDLAINACGSTNALEIISHIIICYFMLEVATRLFYLGRQFFDSLYEIIDGSVILLSFILDLVFTIMDANTDCSSNKVDYAKLITFGRVVRIIRIVRIIYILVQQRRHITSATRRVVSMNKRRYQKDGFDLDLCYITERVIAMSYPSSGIMAVYRNPIREVARFFNTKHPRHYRIYNLCSEMEYDEKLFNNQVERVFIDDHNVPTLRDMIKFCESARAWMGADKRNVMAIHCKGGKGRTGTIICTWLVDCGLFGEAEESLLYFGDRRTDLSVGSQFQGVETPSQSRYVGYYEKVKKEYNGQLPPRRELRMSTIKIQGIKGVGNGDGSDLQMEIRVNGLPIFECNLGTGVNCQVLQGEDGNSVIITLKSCPVLEEDIKVRFLSSAKNIPKVYDHCAFFFWFHTSFIENNRLLLQRDQIDNPHKKMTWKVYKESFSIDITFEEVKN